MTSTLCLVAVVLSSGCGPPPSESSESPPDEKEIPVTARVVCDRDGTRVLTPQVAAQRDGVHLVIDNRLQGDHGFSVRTPEGGGGGDNAPRGESSHVLDDVPPGKARVGCYESPRDMEPNYGALQVVEGGSGYRSVELECRGGMMVTGGPQYAEGARGEKGDPVALVRRGSDRIREGDAVELAGYPEARGHKTVRVVRDGRTVATFRYVRMGGGWLQDNYSACESF